VIVSANAVGSADFNLVGVMSIKAWRIIYEVVWPIGESVASVFNLRLKYRSR